MSFFEIFSIISSKPRKNTKKCKEITMKINIIMFLKGIEIILLKNTDVV